MVAAQPSSFRCSNCNALYQVVKVEAEPDTVDRGITCRCCEAPLIDREGNLVIKFCCWLREAGRVQKWGNAPAKPSKAKMAVAVIEEVS